MEWISVNDRLPDCVFDWVLVFSDGAMATMCYSKEQWFYGYTENRASINEITHWMPLPNPPKN